jgi:Zn-dependent metalloprotease
MSSLPERRQRWLISLGLVLACADPAARVTLDPIGAPGDPQSAASVGEAQEADFRALVAGSRRPVEVEFEGGFPRSLRGSFAATGASPAARAASFLRDHAAFYRQRDPELTLHLTGQAGDAVVLHQRYRGLRVIGAELTVLAAGDRIVATVGALATDLMLGVAPAIAPNQAVEAVSRAAGVAARAAIPPELAVDDPAVAGRPGGPRLVWQIQIGVRRGLVDARTGEVLQVARIDETAFDLDVRDADGDDPLCGYEPYTTFTQAATEAGVKPSHAGDGEANAAFDGFSAAWTFYQSIAGQDSYDDAGALLRVFIHFAFDDLDGSSANGRWNPACPRFDFSDDFVADDLIVHELTHAIVDHGAAGGPDDSSVQGNAVDEHFSDVMAAMADPDWLLGEDSGQGAIRSLLHPDDFGDPAHMADYSSAGGEAHALAGIPNRAAAIMTDGDGAWMVDPLGRTKVRRLYFDAMRAVPSGVTFSSLCDLVVGQAAAYIEAGKHGFVADDLCSIRRSFRAVGIGQGCEGDPGLDDDSIPPAEDNCPLHLNPGQEDADGDGIGDVCDPDDDDDGAPECLPPGLNGCDNCPGKANPDQTDGDFDGKGKACDPDEDDDHDNDGVLNVEDNCPFDHNPQQENVDPMNDDEGDACDPDMDGDGWSNDDDNCWLPNPDQADGDDDLLGDPCDPCPDDPNPGAAIGYYELPGGGLHFYVVDDDSDGDGVPDACDQSFQIGGRASGWGLDVDGARRDVALTGTAGQVFSTALVPCRSRCPEEADPRRRITLAVDGLGSSARAAVVDDLGHATAMTRLDGARVTTDFRAAPGRRYRLQITLSPDHPGTPERGSVTATARLEEDR